MELTCPNCGARYRVAADAIGPDGRTVRCAHCGESWFEERRSTTADTLPERENVIVAPANPAPETVEPAFETAATVYAPAGIVAGDPNPPPAPRNFLAEETEDLPRRGGPSALMILLLVLLVTAAAYFGYGVYTDRIALPG